MKKRLTYKNFFQIFTFVFIFALFASDTHAQDAGRSITILPPKFELFANPSDIVSERIRLRNDSSFPASYTVKIEDFTSSGEEGHVVLEEFSNDSAYSLAAWIEPEKREITLQPGEESSLSFNINVPRDAEPGGHYASIIFQSGGTSIEGGASVAQRIGSLILLKITGNVEEIAEIESFDAPSRSQEGPISFSLRLNNDGNVHIRPKGTIIITNLFGKKIAEFPLNGANVLPGATRKMETEWDETNLLGSYTATLVATYGQQSLPLTAATRFTVASTTSIVLLVIGGLAVLMFIASLFSGRSRILKALRVLFGAN